MHTFIQPLLMETRTNFQYPCSENLFFYWMRICDLVVATPDDRISKWPPTPRLPDKFNARAAAMSSRVCVCGGCVIINIINV